MRKRVFLLDAYALIFRGYYAFIKNPRMTSTGIDTSAILGFLNSVFDVMKREKPELLAVAFDKGGSTDRQEMYELYKANREETPKAIKIAVPYIHKILKALNIPVVEKEGFEADDIIGTLAKKGEKLGYDVYMVTHDKDYGQLVSEHIFIYRPPRGGGNYQIWGVEQVREKFGVEDPLQVTDFLGMMGDASDNIPGLPGVGEKTAMKLIGEFKTMENLLQNTDKLNGKLKERIEQNKELGILSKKLATIMLDVPVEFEEKEFEVSQPNLKEVVDIFEELEFKTLTNTLYKIYGVGEEKKENIQGSLFLDQDLSPKVETKFKTLEDTGHQYELIVEDKKVESLLNQLLGQKEVCLDTETTSVDEMEAEIVGLSISWQKNKGYYIAFGEDFQKSKKTLEILNPFFENENILKIGQNLKYDIKILKKYGIELKGEIFDTMVAHYLINPDLKHSMDFLSQIYLNYRPIEIEELIGKKGKDQKNMRQVEIEKAMQYAVEDSDITLQLKEMLDGELESVGAKKLFQSVEAPLVRVLAEMEEEGIRVDVDFLKELGKEIEKEIRELEKNIHQQANQTFNIASPKQLGEILFEKLKIGEKPKKTKTGQYATSESVLSELVGEHKIIEYILEYRQLQKLQSTYVEALPQQVKKNTKRIHTSFMQTVTATGRLSSNNPNLQNIPIRSKKGQEIRKSFVPKNENYKIMSADYSQIELRIIASLSGEKNMIDDFKNGYDIHRATAAKVFGIGMEEVTKEQRSQAKTVNFGIVYGVSANGLSQQTTLTRSQSKAMIDSYYQTYPMLRQYIDKQIGFARENGYVETILGRRRYLPDINSRNSIVRSAAERNAVNAPIQGSAADIIKIAMVRISEKLKKYKSRMLLQVHDELVFDLHKDEIQEVEAIVKYEMENAYCLQVPLVAEIGIGDNWLEAH